MLRASLNTAVADGVLSVNPCKVKGAGTDRPSERPVASMGEVEVLAGAVTRAMACDGPACVLVRTASR